jgi:hypothetical protein
MLLEWERWSHHAAENVGLAARLATLLVLVGGESNAGEGSDEEDWDPHVDVEVGVVGFVDEWV